MKTIVNRNMAIAMLLLSALAATCFTAHGLPIADRQQNSCLAAKLCQDQDFNNTVIQDVGAVSFENCNFLNTRISGNLVGSMFHACIIESGEFMDVSFVNSTWYNTIVQSVDMENFTFDGSMIMTTVFQNSKVNLIADGSSSFTNLAIDTMNIGYDNLFQGADFSGSEVHMMHHHMRHGPERPEAVPLFVASYQTGYDSETPTNSFLFTGSNLVNTDFSGVHFSGAIFAHSNVSGASFVNANLSYANVYNTSFAADTNYTGADLTGVVGLFESLGSESCEALCGSRGCSCQPVNYCKSAQQVLGAGVDCHDMRLNYYHQIGGLTNSHFDHFQMEAVTFANLSGTPGPTPGSVSSRAMIVYDMDVSNFTLHNSWVNRVQFIQPKNQENNVTIHRVLFESSMMRDVVFLAPSLNGISFTDAEHYGVDFGYGSVNNVNYTDTVLGTIAPVDTDPVGNEQIAILNGFFGDTETMITVSNVRFERVLGEYIKDAFPMNFVYANAENVTFIDSNVSVFISNCESFSDLMMFDSVVPVLSLYQSQFHHPHLMGVSFDTIGIVGGESSHMERVLTSTMRASKLNALDLTSQPINHLVGKHGGGNMFMGGMLHNVTAGIIAFQEMTVTSLELMMAGFGLFSFYSCMVSESYISKIHVYDFQFNASQLLNTTIADSMLDSFNVTSTCHLVNVEFQETELMNGTFGASENINVSFMNVMFRGVHFEGYSENYENVSFSGSNVLNTTGLFDVGGCEDFCANMSCCCVGLGASCTTSTPSPTVVASPSPSSDPCFSGNSFVELETGNMIRIDRLQIGDRVRVGPNAFSEVYLFGHKDPDVISERFIGLTLESGQMLEISDIHLIYCNGKLQAAKHVQVGDLVTLGNGELTTITKVDKIVARGLYNPHTMHGDVVVNGVICSSYTSLVPPMLAHMLLGPARLMYRWIRWNVLGSALEFGIGWKAPVISL